LVITNNSRGALLAALSALTLVSSAQAADTISVGPQYDSTHVYVAPADLDRFTKSFAATFGGTPSKPTTTNIMPVPSSTTFQYVMTPVGTLSVFGFLTPVPYPFGTERTGYLVTDIDKAVAAARASGAEVIVAPFKDPIGRDAVIRWPGGVETQLYWHFTAPNYPALKSVPDNRVYVSPDSADEFVRDFLKFSGGKVVSDDKAADAGEIGRPHETYRRIRIESGFGKMQVLVTDGHLPYPFGHELMGYEVDDVTATLAKAKAEGATVLSAPYAASDRDGAVIQFPGGYIAEIHALKKH
jgi:predicted enzyme related to lactoylglutathione lyase